MDRGACWATAHGFARVGHDLATKLLPWSPRTKGNSQVLKHNAVYFTWVLKLIEINNSFFLPWSLVYKWKCLKLISCGCPMNCILGARCFLLDFHRFKDIKDFFSPLNDCIQNRTYIYFINLDGEIWDFKLLRFTFWQWQPTPVLLPGESQGWQSLAGCHLWGRTKLNTTEAT